ncbi:unnamed protein product [Blepharisma stoltei]|uniref:USP domain-containing protein n=1 Tax=Blepharisma stoltei TaxID=1481888 RepID=A0AAU9IGT8_9CILI|nr:unnamed protein product [Blepharisma stoltei]
MATQNSKVNNSEAMKLNCLYEDWEVCPANLDSHKKPSDEQNTFEISNLKCELEIAIKERDEYKALLKEIEHIRTERNSYEDTINTLRDENAGLKKAIRNIKSVDTDIEKMKKDFKNLKDDQKNNYNRFFKDYEDFKAKIDFAVKSTQEIIKQSSEEEDKTRDQKIISLEANVYSLEYLKAEEIEKNKKLSEKIEKLQRINGKKDQAISELSRKNNEVLAKFKRLKIDYDNLFEEHSNLKKKNNMWCNYLFQGITNSLDKKKLDSLYSTPVGLPNIGQTCYLNSLLQVLVYSPDFIKLTYFSANSLLLSISKIADNINAGSLDSWYRSFYEEFISMFPQVILI